jgi:ABC-2 type transport system permease protein
MILAGGAYLSSGLLASTLTGSQVVAFLVTLFFWLTLGVGAKVAPAYLGDRAARLAFAIDPDLRLKDFAIGLIDTSNLLYFVSIAAVFLIAATTSLRVRRAR